MIQRLISWPVPMIDHKLTDNEDTFIHVNLESCLTGVTEEAHGAPWCTMCEALQCGKRRNVNMKPLGRTIRKIGWIPAVLIVCGLVVAAGGWMAISNTLMWNGQVNPWQPTDENGNPVPFIIGWTGNGPPQNPVKDPNGQVTEDLLTAKSFTAGSSYYVYIHQSLRRQRSPRRSL